MYSEIGCLHEQLEARVKFHHRFKVLDFICLRRLCSLNSPYCHARIPRIGHAKTVQTVQTADTCLDLSF